MILRPHDSTTTHPLDLQLFTSACFISRNFLIKRRCETFHASHGELANWLANDRRNIPTRKKQTFHGDFENEGDRQVAATRIWTRTSWNTNNRIYYGKHNFGFRSHYVRDKSNELFNLDIKIEI